VAGDPDESVVRNIGVSRDKRLEHVEIVIRDFPIGSKPSKTMRTHGERSRRVGVQDIGVPGVVKHLQSEIAIRDFPTRSEPLIWGTRVQGSEGVRVRHFGVSANNGIIAPKIAISRYPIEPKEAVTWRREFTRASGFGISGFLVTRKSRQEKSRNPEM
jgi:hypothetical protein